ncbi:MAG: phage tail tape measure protein, partial [Salinivirgaceae bacterium]|nr:phage tail tape measure protein [Salinivirgaceae bacterium]
MAQGVTLPIKIVKEGNGVEVVERDMTKLEATVTKINLKFKEFAENASKNWEGTVTALNSVNQIVGTLNEHIQKVADSFNSFDKSMRAANTMAGLGEEEFGKMKDSISELGKVIPKTREELANGLYEVISNGVPEDNWLSFLEASAKASVGGIADLGQTVTVTSTIIKNYALSWEEAGNIQDKIQMAAKNGKTSFGELGAALPRVTGSAATLGVTIDELMATFATLTGVSGNTAEVSTQLSAIFTSLIKPTSEASQLAAEMGIQFDAATITAAGGMEQFLAQLKECVQEYSASSGTLETEVYGRLFGSAEAVRALIPLTGNLADKFSDNVAAMADSAGTAEGAFNQMSATGEAQSVMWRNSLASMTDWIGGVLSSKAPMTDFITSAGQSVTSIMAIGTAMKALMATENAQLILTKTLTVVTKAWSAVQAVLNGILAANPISIIVLAIAALVAGVIAAYQKCDKFREVCDILWAAIKNVAAIVWDSLVKAFHTVVDAIKGA